MMFDLASPTQPSALVLARLHLEHLQVTSARAPRYPPSPRRSPPSCSAISRAANLKGCRRRGALQPRRSGRRSVNLFCRPHAGRDEWRRELAVRAGLAASPRTSRPTLFVFAPALSRGGYGFRSRPKQGASASSTEPAQPAALQRRVAGDDPSRRTNDSESCQWN